MKIERFTNPIFNEIVDNLLSLIENNYEKGLLFGVDFDSKSNQEMRDTHDAIELITAIGEKSSKAVPILMKFLEQDIHWWFPGIAAKALGSIGPAAEPAIPLLANLMLKRPGCPHSNWGHLSAAIALGKIGSIEAVPYLIEAAKDPNDQGPGWRAINALGTLGSKAVEALPTLKNLREKEEFSDYFGNIDDAIDEIENET